MIRAVALALVLALIAQPAQANQCSDLRAEIDRQQATLFRMYVEDLGHTTPQRRSTELVERLATLNALAVNVNLMVAARCDTTGIVVSFHPYPDEAKVCAAALTAAIDIVRERATDAELRYREATGKAMRLPQCRGAFDDLLAINEQRTREAREKPIAKPPSGAPARR